MTIYSKYCSHRRPEFRIVTEIREDGPEKYVVKRAGNPAAEQHIHRMTNNRQLIADTYEKVQVLPLKEAADELRFPFVHGRSLKDQLLDAGSDRGQFVLEANRMLETILAVCPECRKEFSPSDGFSKVFGSADPGGREAICPANIDALFSNYLESDGIIYCIDYEWVFDFSVPTDYIRYRALCYLYHELHNTWFESISIEEYMGWFGIEKKDLDIFDSMELAFQYYVHGDHNEYQYLTRHMKRTWVPQNEVARLEEETRKKSAEISNLDAQIEEKDAAIRDRDIRIEEQDAAIRDRDIRIEEQDAAIRDRDARIGEKDAVIQKQNHDNENLHETIRGLESHMRETEAQRARYEGMFIEISTSFFWRITKPARWILIKLKTLVKKNKNFYLFFRTLKRLFREGPKSAANLWKTERKRIENTLSFVVPEKEVQRQKETKFSKSIKFSILVPLYNTSRKYLLEMIESVMGQTYENWELCLADGSDAEHGYVQSVCKELAKKDKRIRYIKLKQNLGISENTNACLDIATGDYIGLFDHDDILHPSALYEYMRVICDEDADFIYSDEHTFRDSPADAMSPHYKPDYSPDTLRSYNYICHFTVFSRKLLEKTGGQFRKQFDGSQDYDIILRLTENAEHIVHVPKPIYYWRVHDDSTSANVGSKPYIIDAAKEALAEHLKRVGLDAQVLDSRMPSSYKIQYRIEGEPLISIIIPNKDHIQDLEKCLSSIREKTTWQNWEIIVVENNSTETETFEYYKNLEPDNRIQVVTWKGPFNYSAINNYGAQFAHGEYLLLLNNDTEIITPDWLEQMLMFAQRKDVGAVGAMLYYPDDTVQHAGIIIGLGGIAAHSHRNYHRGDIGYSIRLTIAQNLSAVTGACMMIPRKVWDEVRGLNETDFAVAFNDVDICLRIREAGYLIVWTPYAELYHYESKSRGYEDTPEKQERLNREKDNFARRWRQVIDAGDPYYNPNLTLSREDFTPRDD